MCSLRYFEGREMRANDRYIYEKVILFVKHWGRSSHKRGVCVFKTPTLTRI